MLYAFAEIRRIGIFKFTMATAQKYYNLRTWKILPEYTDAVKGVGIYIYNTTPAGRTINLRAQWNNIYITLECLLSGHYSDVTWAPGRPKSPATQLFIH